MHGLIAAAVAMMICISGLANGLGWSMFAAPAGILLGSWLLSPDLDMANTQPTKRWGVFQYFWRPYAWMFKHRGLSHGWITGPLSRLLYIGTPIALAWWCAELEAPGAWLGFLLLGVIVGNWVHLLGDL